MMMHTGFLSIGSIMIKKLLSAAIFFIPALSYAEYQPFDVNVVTGGSDYVTVTQCINYVCNDPDLSVVIEGDVSQLFIFGSVAPTLVRGATGATGDKGDKGDQGEQGIQGIAGERGADGKDGKDADMSLFVAETEERKAVDEEHRQQLEAARITQQDHSNNITQQSRRIASTETRVSNLESNFSKLKSQVENNRREARAGIAGVAAMASIPSVVGDQKFAIGAGVGTHGGQSAVSVGSTVRFNSNVTGKMAFAADTQDQVTFGAGVAIGW